MSVDIGPTKIPQQEDYFKTHISNNRRKKTTFLAWALIFSLACRRGGMIISYNRFNLLGTNCNMSPDMLLNFFIMRTMLVDNQILVEDFHLFSLSLDKRNELLNLNAKGMIFTHLSSN